MSEPIILVAVRDGRVYSHASRWGGGSPYCDGDATVSDHWSDLPWSTYPTVAAIREGCASLFSNDELKSPRPFYDPDGVYLIDFDTQRIIYGWLQPVDQFSGWKDFDRQRCNRPLDALSQILNYFNFAFRLNRSVKSDRFPGAPTFSEDLQSHDLDFPAGRSKTFIEELCNRDISVFEFGESLLERVFGIKPAVDSLVILSTIETVTEIAHSIGLAIRIGKTEYYGCSYPLTVHDGTALVISGFLISDSLWVSRTEEESLEAFWPFYTVLSVDSLFRKFPSNSLYPGPFVHGALADVWSQTARISRHLTTDWHSPPHERPLAERATLLKRKYGITLCTQDASSEHFWNDQWNDEDSSSPSTADYVVDLCSRAIR
jgi:hypothetical protein